MTIPNTVNVLTAVGPQSSPLSLPFLVVQQADVAVYLQSAAGVTPVKLTLNTDYTVALLNQLAGAQLLFVSSGAIGTSLATGAILTISRDPAQVQTTALQAQGPFPAPSVQQITDQLTTEVQANRTRITNSIQIPLVESLSGITTVLPTASQRANSWLVFDVSGNVSTSTVAGIISPIVSPNGLVQNVATIAALEALAIPTAAVVFNVEGYYAVGDGGGGLFEWNAASTTTADGGTVLSPGSAPASGRWLRIMPGGATTQNAAVRARWFGFIPGQSAATNTTRLQAAINYFTLGQGTIIIDAGNYSVGPVTLAHDGMRLLGMGQNQTLINFVPTTSSACITFNSGAEMFRCGVWDMEIFSSDTAYTKTALDVYDTSDFTLERCYIVMTGGPSSTLTSIGLRTHGRELLFVQNNNINCDIPIQHSVDANTSLVNCDHFQLIHNYLLANGNPCILFDDGTVITNYTVDGCALVRGTYGVYRSDTTSGYASYNIKFTNIRTEQSSNAADYSFYLKSTAQTQQAITFDNIELDPTCKGIYVNKADHVAMRQLQYGGTLLAIYVDNLYSLVVDQCFFQSTSTVTLGSTTPMVAVIQMPASLSGSPIPEWGIYVVKGAGTNFEANPPLLVTGTKTMSISGTLLSGHGVVMPASTEGGRQVANFQVAVYGYPFSEGCVGFETVNGQTLLQNTSNFVTGSGTPSSGKVGFIVAAATTLYNNLGDTVDYVATYTWI